MSRSLLPEGQLEQLHGEGYSGAGVGGVIKIFKYVEIGLGMGSKIGKERERAGTMKWSSCEGWVRGSMGNRMKI